MQPDQRFKQYADRLQIPHDVDWSLYELPMEEAAKLRDASEYREQVKQSFLLPEEKKGLRLPWKKADDLRFRDGEMTVWTGYNGHRKSMLIGQCALAWLSQGADVCIASLEMKPWKSLKRMTRQYVGVKEPAIPAQDEFFDWAEGHLRFYDQVGTVDPKRMIAVCRFAITELGINHMVIDSLMKCGIEEDDLNRQKWFVNELQTMAQDTNSHIHLVAHQRKPYDGKEHAPGEKYGVAGSGNITNLVDNVLNVHWNKKKEDLKNKGDEVDDNEGDAYLVCRKQREGESEPLYKLYFDERCIQFKGWKDAPKLSAEEWKGCQWQ